MCKAPAYYSGGFAGLHSIEALHTKRLGSKYQSDKNALAYHAVTLMIWKMFYSTGSRIGCDY